MPRSCRLRPTISSAALRCRTAGRLYRTNNPWAATGTGRRLGPGHPEPSQGSLSPPSTSCAIWDVRGRSPFPVTPLGPSSLAALRNPHRRRTCARSQKWIVGHVYQVSSCAPAGRASIRWQIDDPVDRRGGRAPVRGTPRHAGSSNAGSCGDPRACPRCAGREAWLPDKQTVRVLRN